MIWANYIGDLFLFAYCLGLFLGYGTALDLVEQAREAGFKYKTKWEITKWWLTPRKHEAIKPNEIRRAESG